MLPVGPSGIKGGGGAADAATLDAPIRTAAIPIAAIVSFLKGGPFIRVDGYEPTNAAVAT